MSKDPYDYDNAPVPWGGIALAVFIVLWVIGLLIWWFVR